MPTPLKWIIYIISAWISIKFADGYWAVGTVFGLAVIAFDSNGFRNFNRQKHIQFLVASVVIYALVYWTAMRKWESSIDLINYLIGPFTLGVILGSVLLPSVHRMIFEKSKAQTQRVIFALIGSFYSVMFLGYIGKYWVGVQVNMIAAYILVWQGAYLYFFFVRPGK